MWVVCPGGPSGPVVLPVWVVLLLVEGVLSAVIAACEPSAWVGVFAPLVGLVFPPMWPGPVVGVVDPLLVPPGWVLLPEEPVLPAPLLPLVCPVPLFV